MIYNQDCLEAMKEMSDNQFNLAIVDPPYGINITKNKRLNNNSKKDWDKEIPTPDIFFSGFSNLALRSMTTYFEQSTNNVIFHEMFQEKPHART